MRINIKLQEEMTDNFLKIKRSLGIENNTEVLRFIITDYYNKNMNKS